MGVSDTFLPKFEISKSLGNDLRNIKIAKELSTGWYKGQLNYHYKKAGLISVIDGEEYYMPIKIRDSYFYPTNDFFKKGTQGYHIAEIFRLYGIDDSGLREINEIASNDDVDWAIQRWKAKDDFNISIFRRYLQNMKDDLSEVDTIEIDYELQRYKQSDYPTEVSRVYNTRESIYGHELSDKHSFDGVGVQKWTTDGRYLSLPSIMTKLSSSLSGNAIRFKKGLLDITDTITPELRFAVQTMIAYSGNDFMTRLSFSKTSEKTVVINKYRFSPYGATETATYISPIGTEIYDANILNAFVKDKDEKHWKRYTRKCIDYSRSMGSPCRGTLIPAISLTTGDGIKQVTTSYYTGVFWSYTKYRTSNTLSFLYKPSVRGGDEFLFRDSGNEEIGAYINVKEFNKLSLDDIGYYVSNYFDVHFFQKRSSGFFSGFLSFLGEIFGFILNIVFDIYMFVPALRISAQLLTWAVNTIFSSDLTDRDMFDLGMQIVGTVLSIALPVVGTIISVAISLGNAYNKAEREAKENQDKEDAKKPQQEKDKADKEKKAEEDKQKQKLDMNAEEQSMDEFDAFLRDPLYKVKREKNQIMSDMKSQFKLL